MAKNKKLLELRPSPGLKKTRFSTDAQHGRNCKLCKHHDEYETISIKVEVEKASTTYPSTLILKTPKSLLHSSLIRMAPNKDRAIKLVFHQQLRKLNLQSNLQGKDNVIKSEQKLQELGSFS